MNAASLYAEALRGMRTLRGNPLALARAASRADPGFVSARQLEAWLLLCSRDRRDFEAAGWAYADFAGRKLEGRERRHAAAIAATVDGDYAGASRMITAMVARDPYDLVALLVGQVFDYYLGNPEAPRRRSEIALRTWTEADAGYHAVLSLQGMALVECGEYAAADTAARAALVLEPGDVRAHHAVTHLLEMQGRADEGLRWMGTRAAHWAGAGATTAHLWWHLALFQAEFGRAGLVLETFERRLKGDTLSDMIDASALLWRLQLAGFDVAARWPALAARWAPHAEDAHCAFNDLHAMMAFAGARRWDSAGRLLQAQARRIELAGSGANHDMTKLVGYPACRAIAAFGREDYAAAEALLRALPPVVHRIGGSHAQRDILQLTRAAAAQRRGVPRLRAVA
jgi:hypothetical protein